MAFGTWIGILASSLVVQQPAPAVFPLAQAPTRERIEAFLTSHHTQWSEGGDDFWLAPNFRSGYRGSNTDCRGDWKATQGGVRANIHCNAYDDAGRLKKRQPPPGSFELEVLLVGPDILVATVPEGYRLVMACEHGKAACRALKDTTLVEMIPGADERALWDGVAAVLKQHAAAHPNVVLFEGPRAQSPRAVTEVYFSGDREKAVRVAEELSDVTGPVEVQPWPGPWPYDVVVVVGATKVPSR